MTSLSEPIKIRPAVLPESEPNDLSAMYKLDVSCFEEPFRFSVANLERYVLDRDALSFVAEPAALEDSGLAGYVVVQLYARTRSAYVVTLDVAPEYRRRGLAGRLMQAGEAAVAARGALSMHLHVHAGNAAAIRFYERCGYERQRLEAELYGPGLDAWVYGKAL